MKTILAIILIIILPSSALVSQTTYDKLRRKLLHADSVFAICYESFGDSIQGLQHLLKKEYLPLLSITQKRLNKTQVIQLTHILTNGERIIGRKTVTRVFKPRNAILIYSTSTLSYIDICFHCKRVATTKDLHFDDFDLKTEKWEAIKKFFVDLSLEVN